MGGGSKVKGLDKINHAAFKKTLDAVAHAKNAKIMTIRSAYNTSKRCVDGSSRTAGLSYQDGFDFTHDSSPDLLVFLIHVRCFE